MPIPTTFLITGDFDSVTDMVAALQDRDRHVAVKMVSPKKNKKDKKSRILRRPMMSELQTEIVFTWTPIDGSARVAFTSWDDLVGDVMSWCDDDIEGSIGTITVERKPSGFVAALPEFEGW